MRFPFSALAVLAGVLSACVAGEIVLRVFDLSFGTSPMDPHPIVHHWHPPNLTLTFRNPTGEDDGFRVAFNNAGMVSSRDLLPHDEGIVVLGDSFVEGGNVPEDSRLSTVIERDTGIRTFNLGMSSFSPLLSRLVFDMYQDRITPRVVVEVIYANDIRDDPLYREDAATVSGRIVAVPGPDGLRAAAMKMVRRIYIARLVAHALALYRTETRPDAIRRLDRPYFNRPLPATEPPEHLRFTEQNIQSIADSARRAGSRPYLTTVPDRGALLQGQTDFLNEHMKAVAARAGIDYIDLVPAFQRIDHRAAFFKRDIHWNSRGHTLAGEVIAERIRADRARGFLR